MRFPPPRALCAALLATFILACGSMPHRALVTIEPIASTTPRAAATVPLGGKPAAPTPAPTDASQAAQTDAATVAPDPASGGGSTSASGLAPAHGRWIEVDVTNVVVRLMDGSTVLREIAPVAVGAQIDTGEYESTQTGLFHVYSKVEGLAYDAPYATYISHWVGFDPDKANGFHSFLKDAAGKVVDASTGRVSNGCIRTGEEAEIFAFAELGMPVWVHV